jgi:adenylate cyclase
MWHVAVYQRDQHAQFRSVRARFALTHDAGTGQWTFAEDPSSRDASMRLQMRAQEDKLRLECGNIGGHIELADGGAFWAAKPVELTLPCLFRVGETWFEVRSTSTAAATGLEPLRRSTPKERAVATALVGPEAATVAKWLSSVGQLHRTAASSPLFFTTAAQLTLDSTGLDAALVLTREGDSWDIAGSAVPRPQFGISYDAAALALVFDQPDVWRCPAMSASTAELGPCASQQSVVVAPVLDDQGDVIAALYGMRHGQGDNRRRGIRPLEARVIELMADAVGAGMARRAQEIESARQQVLLEQAFSPVVVEHLQRRPEALAGCTRDVTLLFADLRGFTGLAESLSPADAYELLGEALEKLTQAVMDHGGVLIDYYGDGLCALWNAPLELPEHADLACAAAMQMLDELPAVSDQWRTRIGQALELGIGLHSGEVQVGNAGTRRRLKYGPRGLVVNIASRVQAATRQVDVNLLVTDAVRRRLSARFVTLKACTARLPGLEQPVDLFTVFPATDGQRLQQDFEQYAAALAAFEDGEFDHAERVLGELLASGPATPAAFLAQQAAALRQGALGRRATDQGGRPSEPVIEILAK